MKNRHRWLVAAVALALTCAMLAASFVLPSVAAPAAERLSDEQSRKTEEIVLPDGTKTGVTWSQIAISGPTYGEDRVVNVADCRLSNTHLSMEVINSGTYMVSAKTLSQAAADYNAAHQGQTVLAAVNGDLWMTAVHSGTSVTTKVLKVSRGVMIVDGEIWASQQLDQENLDATNAEKGASAGNKAAFGVTTQNQPLVGSPDIQVKITVNGKTITADGINRLPARNALVVYNHRVNSANYALNDAYEIELEVSDSSAFRAGGTITATVKKIYPANSTVRPAIGEKSIILTARGNRISTVKDQFKVGDTVTFQTTLTDRMGRTELWQDVTDAIGGHMQPIIDGKLAVANGSTTAYPTSFVGYRDDGSVALVTVTSAKDGSRAALRMADAYKFCTEMGYNSVFYLDGGGSATFITLDEGSYTVRNKCSDGSPRAVINGIAVVWNEEKVCERQGSLDYIKVPVDMSAIPPTYLDGALLNDLIPASSANQLTVGYDQAEKAFRMTTSVAANDPFAPLEFSSLQRVSADDYPYLVFKVKTNDKRNTQFVLYYAAGKDNVAAAGRTKSFTVKPGMDEWQYITVDMSRLSNWTGTINNIRLDIFDSVSTPADTSLYIGAIVLCKTADEAAKVKDGWAPEGAITDYLAYLESLKPVVTEPETDAPTEPAPETEAPTSPVTDAVTEVPTGGSTEPETDVPTAEDAESAADSAAETATESVAESTTTPASAESGCASTVGIGLSLLLLGAAAAVTVLRKKD